MSHAGALYYPNRMGRIILESMEEVVGRNGLNAVLNLAGQGGLIGNYPPYDQELEVSFETVSGWMDKLEQAYGPRGGRGLAVRIGRVAFKYGLREFGCPVLPSSPEAYAVHHLDNLLAKARSTEIFQSAIAILHDIVEIDAGDWRW
jgi:hypothetical protein